MFWPVAVKGGAENTLRDLMLFDLNAAAGDKFLYTGERNRLDIAAYDLQTLKAAKPGRTRLPGLCAAIELKFNYITQKSELNRAAEKLQQMKEHDDLRGVALVAVQFLCEIWGANCAEAVLLVRYGGHRMLKNPSNLLKEHLSQLPRSPTRCWPYVSQVVEYAIRKDAGRPPVGRIAAVVWLPSGHSSTGSGVAMRDASRARHPTAHAVTSNRESGSR